MDPERQQTDTDHWYLFGVGCLYFIVLRLVWKYYRQAGEKILVIGWLEKKY